MILDRSEILAVLGIADTADTPTLGLINYLHPRAEKTVKRAVRCNLESATYTHYLPTQETVPSRDPFLDGAWDVLGSRVVELTGNNITGGRLTLPEIPVRSISRVCVDYQAYAGQHPGAFPSSADLTQGVHYWLDAKTDGFSTTGQIIRIAGAWPTIRGSVLVTYTAGYTRAELDGDSSASPIDASDLKQAVMLTFLSGYNTLRAMQKGASGPVVKERIGNYSVQYDPGGRNVPVTSGFHLAVPAPASELLQPYIHYARMLGT